MHGETVRGLQTRVCTGLLFTCPLCSAFWAGHAFKPGFVLDIVKHARGRVELLAGERKETPPYRAGGPPFYE